MTDNLKLVGPRTLTSANSDVASNFTLPASSTSGWCTDSQQSCIDLANVLYSNNTTYGTYYSYVAATAGSGGYSISSGNAPYSICPKSWRLPTGGSGGELQALYAKYSSNTRLWENPVTLARAGFVYETVTAQGETSLIWSSRIRSEALVLDLGADSSGAWADDASNHFKFLGETVRCIAK